MVAHLAFKDSIQLSFSPVSCAQRQSMMDFRNGVSLTNECLCYTHTTHGFQKWLFAGEINVVIREFPVEMIAELKLLLALSEGSYYIPAGLRFPSFHISFSGTLLENLGLHWAHQKPLIHLNPFILLTRKLKSRASVNHPRTRLLHYRTRTAPWFLEP